MKAFEADYGAKWPKSVAKVNDDPDVLLEFYDYPAEHWVYLRTTNPSNRRSPPCASASASPRDPAPGPPGWRSRSSSWSQHRPGGAPSTHPTWCHSCEQEPHSTRGNSSNDPTIKEVNSKSPETSSTGLDYFSPSLWADRCRAHGHRISWRTFALYGVIVVPILLTASVGALALTSN